MGKPSEVYLQTIWINIQAVNDSVRFEDMRDSTEESRLNTALIPILYAGLATKQTRKRKTVVTTISPKLASNN